MCEPIALQLLSLDGLPVFLQLIDSPSQIEILLGKEKINSPLSYGVLLLRSVKHSWWDLCIRGRLITMLY